MLNKRTLGTKQSVNREAHFQSYSVTQLRAEFRWEKLVDEPSVCDSAVIYRESNEEVIDNNLDMFIL